jgi:deazaflavin-dependent oxidoreductase (nitroreductase family)
MKNFFIKCFMAFNKFLIRISGGRMGTQMRIQKVFIMHTIGRKTGQSRAVPIAYFIDGNNFFVVGSNWGQPKNASWYFNLKDNPHAMLEISGEKISVLAREAEGDEYARLWQIAIEKNPPYEEYKKNAGRHIPIMIFERVS